MNLASNRGYLGMDIHACLLVPFEINPQCLPVMPPDLLDHNLQEGDSLLLATSVSPIVVAGQQ